jgi:hypothetical protein
MASRVLKALLTGNDTCSVKGITARGSAPVLVLCRKLLDAGYPPHTTLEVYRGPTPALTIRSIGVAAGLEINSSGTGFRRFRPRSEPRAASPMRKSREAA